MVMPGETMADQQFIPDANELEFFPVDREFRLIFRRRWGLT